MQYANLKARANIIIKVTGKRLIPEYLQTQKNLSNNFIQKLLVGLTVKLCDDKQSEIRQAAIKLLQ